MMTVEEKPDVTYNDVGGCKDQIEKMREVSIADISFFFSFFNFLLCLVVCVNMAVGKLFNNMRLNRN